MFWNVGNVVPFSFKTKTKRKCIFAIFSSNQSLICIFPDRGETVSRIHFKETEFWVYKHNIIPCRDEQRSNYCRNKWNISKQQIKHNNIFPHPPPWPHPWCSNKSCLRYSFILKHIVDYFIWVFSKKKIPKKIPCQGR